jgi:hypothetical protein
MPLGENIHVPTSYGLGRITNSNCLFLSPPTKMGKSPIRTCESPTCEVMAGATKAQILGYVIGAMPFVEMRPKPPLKMGKQTYQWTRGA